jgi:DNA-binding CsgD family transcriptional regulator
MNPLSEHTAVRLVALYHDVLSAILDGPEGFVDIFTRTISTMIPCHGFVMIVEPDPSELAEGGRADSVAHVRIGRQAQGTAPQIQMRPLEIEPGHDMRDELIAGAERDIAATMASVYPEHGGLYVHWLRSGTGVAAAIFRVNRAEENHGDYSPEELRILGEIEPHILNCVRVYQEISRAQRATYDFFAERCGVLAVSSGLTSTEERVLRKMVEGATNKAISEDLGISLATVKTHISHILQKTGCRNRTDLIGKHFSSKQAAVGAV